MPGFPQETFFVVWHIGFWLLADFSIYMRRSDLQIWQESAEPIQ
jgi:hypothetical protein